MAKVRLREIRKERSLSFRDLHILTGVGVSTLHLIEKNHNPKLKTLARVAAGLKLKVSDLLEE